MKALKRSENHSEMLTFQKIWNTRNIRNIVVKRYSCTLLRDSMGRNSAAKLSGNSDLPALNRRVWEWHLNGFEILSSRHIQDSLWWTRWTLLSHAPNGIGKQNIFLAFDTQYQYSISVWFCLILWFCLLYIYMSAKIRQDALASWQSKSSQTSVWSTFS